MRTPNIYVNHLYEISRYYLNSLTTTNDIHDLELCRQLVDIINYKYYYYDNVRYHKRLLLHILYILSTLAYFNDQPCHMLKINFNRTLFMLLYKLYRYKNNGFIQMWAPLFCEPCAVAPPAHLNHRA